MLVYVNFTGAREAWDRLDWAGTLYGLSCFVCCMAMASGRQSVTSGVVCSSFLAYGGYWSDRKDMVWVAKA